MAERCEETGILPEVTGTSLEMPGVPGGVDTFPDRFGALPDIAEQLSLLAEQNYRQPTVPVWEQQFELISACLETGDDRTLREAIHRLARRDPPAARALKRDIEFAATHRIGWTRPDRAGVIRLVALPLFLYGRKPRQIPRSLILPDAIRRSLRIYQLLDPASREDFYLLSPDLYDPEQLGKTGFSELHALTRQLEGGDEYRHWLTGSLFPESAALSLPGGEQCVVRYLLGGWRTPAGIDPSIEFPHLEHNRRAWRTALAAEIGRQLNVTATVGDPRPFFTALRRGATDYQCTALRMRLSRLICARMQRGQGLTGILSVHGHQGRPGQVQVGIFIDGVVATPVLTHAWPLAPEESAARVMAALTVLLHQSGVLRVRRQDGVLPLRHCEHCGAPFAVAPEGQVLAHTDCMRRHPVLH